MSDQTELNTFLKQLQEEAELQAKLHSTRVLPQRLDTLTNVVGRYPWQVLVLTSGITAVLMALTRLYA